MKKVNLYILFVFLFFSCKSRTVSSQIVKADSSLINTDHLDHLYTPVIFADGTKAAGIYIYSEAPDYHLVADSDEGFTCVDDVSRATLVYLRHKKFLTDTSVQKKVSRLLSFIIKMQSGEGYFYNFLFTGNTINTAGKTSTNTASWWSWRALQTLTEASPVIKKIDEALAHKIDTAINRLIIKIRPGFTKPLITKNVNGIKVPQWLPAESAADQSSILILALINYCAVNNDDELKKVIRKLADGIVMMQYGNEAEFPYSCFLSWENVWHAYGSDQSYALLKAGKLLNDSGYIKKALAEVDNFYPWLLKNGLRSSFSIIKKGEEFIPVAEKQFPQIAYNIRPMVFAAAEAYRLTGRQKYAAIAGQLTAWFFGANEANEIIYNKRTGRCFDGILTKDSVNKNAGAESTIEALLALQKAEEYPEIISAMNKYNKRK